MRLNLASVTVHFICLCPCCAAGGADSMAWATDWQVPRRCSAGDFVSLIRDHFYANCWEAEFMCACDVSKVFPATLQQLNDAQVGNEAAKLPVCGITAYRRCPLNRWYEDDAVDRASSTIFCFLAGDNSNLLF